MTNIVTMVDSQLLAPWEYEGEVPQVVEEGALLWNRCLVRFELLQVENYVGVYDLRIRQTGDDGSWHVVLSDPRIRSHELIQKNVEEEAKNNRIRREFFIDSEVVRIYPNGAGYWYQNDHTMSYFLLGRSVARLTSSQTYEMIWGLLAKPSSDVACALRFKRLNHEEKWNRIFGFATEEARSRAEAELRDLCRYVLYSENGLWNQKSVLCWFLNPSEREYPARFTLLLPNRKREIYESPNMSFWARALEQFGPLQPHLNRLCVREYFQFLPRLVRGELAAPSSHEQLEARLFLREWGREHLPSDVWVEMENMD